MRYTCPSHRHRRKTLDARETTSILMLDLVSFFFKFKKKLGQCRGSKDNGGAMYLDQCVTGVSRTC